MYVATENFGSDDTSDSRRGLPLTSSRLEKIFPKLTQAQITRIAAYGRTRSVQTGDVLIEQGDISMPFFVVITGEVEIVRPFGAHESCHVIRHFFREIKLVKIHFGFFL